MAKCKETMASKEKADHIHVCSGEHDGEDHMCSDPKCRRYFWKKGARV